MDKNQRGFGVHVAPDCRIETGDALSREAINNLFGENLHTQHGYMHIVTFMRNKSS
jgi:hypothetical protein